MSVIEKKRTSRIKSALWNHFRKTDCEYFAECNYCSKSLSYKTTIANLKKHLFRIHPHFAICDTNIKDFSKVDEDSEESIAEVVNDEELVERDSKDDVWNYFEKQPCNRVRCILCKETFNRFAPYLRRHMNEKHPKILADVPSDSDEEQDCYTEVVYLEEEQPLKVEKKFKPNSLPQTPLIRKRSRGSVRPRHEKRDSSDANFYMTTKEPSDTDEDIDNFGRYVTGLLKKLPKDLCMQLQMDIINLIMKAKLSNMAPKATVTSNHTVQDGAIIVTVQNNVNESSLLLQDNVEDK